ACAGRRAATGIQGDALALPCADGAFERIVTVHFYGHLNLAERREFLSRARRIAPELVIIDSHVRPDHDPEEQQTRILNDGSRFEVYKRYFDGPGLLAELGGAGRVLHDGDWFVVVASRASLTQARGPTG